MSTNKMQIQDEYGNTYHPETSADVVKYKGNNVKETLETLTSSISANTDAANIHYSNSASHITNEERVKWNQVSNKVDKINGMGLSSNDFTTAEKNKLASISNNANNYTHPSYTSKANGLYKVTVDSTGHIAGTTIVSKSDITALGIPAQDTTYSVATTLQDGLMSSSDKSKLDSIAKGAQVNTITGIKGNAESSYRTGNVNLTPDNIGAAPSSHTHTKSQITDMPTKLSQFTNDAGYIKSTDSVATQSHTHANKSVLDNIIQSLVDKWNSAYTHISDAVKHITSAERTLWNTVSNKLDKSGGTLTGNVTFSGDNSLAWSRNTDCALIKFKNTSDSDTDSYMEFQTGDNGNEYFKFSHKTSSGVADWLTIKSDHLRFKGNPVYHVGNKPGKSDVGLGNVDNTSDLNKPISTATQNALNGKANSNHTHDDRYYTESEIDTKLNGKANSSHNHDVITGGNANLLQLNAPNDWAGLEHKNNVNIDSWWGVSFSNKCPGQPVPVDGVGVSIDARQGKIMTKGDIRCEGRIYVQGQDLFQSVSDGKSAIANAITGKGVPTSGNDTFSTMANNIVQIPTGISTDDATATADDILSGKTAYARGAKITGNMANMGSITDIVSVGTSGTRKYFRIPRGAYLTNTPAGYPEVVATATQIDSNIQAQNILKGVSICGVAGLLDLASLGGSNYATGVTSTLGNSNTREELISLPFTPRILITNRLSHESHDLNDKKNYFSIHIYNICNLDAVFANISLGEAAIRNSTGESLRNGKALGSVYGVIMGNNQIKICSNGAGRIENIRWYAWG